VAKWFDISDAGTVAELPPAVPTPNRLEFETLLSNTSAQLIVIESDRLGETVESALEAARSFFRADRCCILTVSDDREIWQGAYTAFGDGVPPISKDINLAQYYPWVTQRVVFDQETLILSSLDEMPPEAALDRASCEAMGIRSFVNIPIKVGPSRLHMMHLNSVSEEREWPEEFVPRLRLLGEMLVNTIERVRESDLAREQAVRVAAAVDAAELGFGEWKLGMVQPYLDNRMCDLLGIGIGEFENARELWVQRAQADVQPRLSEQIQRLQAGEIERTHFEYQYNHPQRGLIWLQHSSRRLEEGGGPPRIIVAIEDVTERRRALEDLQLLREKLEHENVYLRQEVKERFDPEGIVGRGPAIRRTLTLAEQVATTNSTVLLLGETGSGKERFASYIHERSRRRDRPMIRINCSAIPPSLIESELFGREKGAYTGALSKQIGRFELAHGSTLFLDEIGELPVDLQVKLLRVLESHTIERLGSPKPILIDVRIIAATNRNLTTALQDGRFRQDLYYRLNVFPITVPPLRERQEDIPLFIDAFVAELAGTMGKPIQRIEPEDMKALVGYAWPGNVRELRNLVERAMIMSNGPNLRIVLPEIHNNEAGLQPDLDPVERTHILDVLNKSGWRIRGAHGAAAHLGIKPTTLESRMKKLGLTRPVG
jgi:formate hydrogenlyase transcriptional activator